MCGHLKISMKLQVVSVISVLSLMGFVGLTNGFCLVRNTTTPNQYWYQCFRSNDYLADMKRSPVDVYGHTVSNSKIKVIRNGCYTRLGRSLESLAVLYCGVEEIEDNAFQGLTKLKLMAFMGNKLNVIKSSWFEGLSNLKVISFENNRVKYVENNFFSILPRSLDILDISSNELTCLPTTSVGNFNVSEIHFKHNPLTWTCQVLVMDWLKETNIREDWLDFGNMDPPYDLAKICVAKLPRPRLDEEFFNKCAEETSRGYLPPTGDYTVKQVCEFLKDKPSPFLDCHK